MNEPEPQQAPQLTSNMSRPVSTEDTYIVMLRTLSNGVQVLEYVERQGSGNLIAAIRVDN